MITIKNIVNLFVEGGSIQIYINCTEHLYQFPIDELPEELLYMYIESIDNPEYNAEGHPLCININEQEFDDYNAFKEEFQEYIV